MTKQLLQDTEEQDPFSKIDEYIGKRIREKRQKLSLTLSDLSDKMGITLQQVQKYEQGKSRISAGFLYKIARIFSVQPSFFYDGLENLNSKFLRIDEAGDISFERPQSINIFMIEDDSSDELLVRNILSSSKYDVKIFNTHDGEKALDFLRNKNSRALFPRPDIILLDLNIPKRDGLFVLKEIKRDPEIQDIPVIILTNSISVQEMVASYRNHASGYICKSFDLDIFHKNLVQMVEYWAGVVVLPRMAI